MRRVGFVGTEAFGLGDTTVELKCYEVVFGERETEDREPIRTAARGVTQGCVTRDMAPTAHHALGFTVLHHGEDSEWLLVCWWTHECILCQSLHRADRGSDCFKAYPGTTVACTWELVVHAHEREAWVRHVMLSDADGWRARYLADTVGGMF